MVAASRYAAELLAATSAARSGEAIDETVYDAYF
jgi:hypothetical protein